MDAAKPPVGRPRTRDKEEPRQYVGFPVSVRLKGQLEAAAQANGRSLSVEAATRLEQSFVAAYPPEVGALAELLARSMFETTSFIAKANRVAGHGSVSWFDDAYAYDQAMKAVIRLIEKAKPKGNPTPHGIFATIENIDGDKIGDQVGAQVADGFIEVLAGRYNAEGSREALWLPRNREELGAIGNRLAEQPEADDYWGPSTTKPGRVVMVPTAKEGVFDLQVAADDENSRPQKRGEQGKPGDDPTER